MVPCEEDDGRWVVRWAGHVEGMGGLLAALDAGNEPSGELTRLRGAFVVLIWDRYRQTGIVARDQLGGRDLFYTRDRGGFAFATEMPLLLDLVGRTPAPDPVSVACWLGSGTLPVGRSFYEGVDRLPPGHLVPLVPNPVPRRWWRLTDGAPKGRAPGDLAAQVMEQTQRAVKRSLPAGGAPAVLLSGGLDSATVLSVAAEQQRSTGRERPVAYSALFPEHAQVDERRLIEDVSDQTKVRNVRAEVTGGDALVASLRHLERWRVPATSLNQFIWQPMHERIRADGHAVVLDGEGGDEVFGMQPWYLVDLIASGRVPRAWGLTTRIPGFETRPTRAVRLRILRHFLRRGLPPHAVQRFAGLHGPATRYAPDLLNATAARHLRQAYDPWAWKRLSGPLWKRRLVYALTDEREILDAHGYLYRRAAGAQLDARHPFLHDVDLLQSTLAVPPDALFDSAYDRPLLRHGLAGRLPDSVRLRAEKSYFTSIANSAMSGTSNAFLTHLLADRQALIREWIDPAWIADKSAAVAQQPLWETSVKSAAQLFRLGTLECWLQSMADSAWPETQLAKLPPQRAALFSVREAT